MNTENRHEFKKIIETTFLTFGRNVPPKEVMQVWWSVFEQFPMEDVRHAFCAAVAESTEFLVPGRVRKYIPDRSGYLDPETAWNQVPKADADAAWVCTEMLEASALAQDSIDRRDMIAARMAFLEAYKRVIENAKAQWGRPQWFYSEATEGSRDQRRRMKINHTKMAMERQWIPRQIGADILMQLDAPPINPAMQDIAHQVNAQKRIENSSVKMAS